MKMIKQFMIILVTWIIFALCSEILVRELNENYINSNTSSLIIGSSFILQMFWSLHPSRYVQRKARKDEKKRIYKKKKTNLSLSAWKKIIYPQPVMLLAGSIAYAWLLCDTKLYFSAKILIVYIVIVYLGWIDWVWLEENAYLRILRNYVKKFFFYEYDDQIYILKYGILRVDETESIPVTFSKDVGQRRPVNTVIFDWETEINPLLDYYNANGITGKQHNIAVNSKLYIYVYSADLHTEDELIDLCEKAFTYEHHHISKMIYIYIVGDGNKLGKLSAKIDTWQWLNEVEISIVDKPEKIDLFEVVEDYEHKRKRKLLIEREGKNSSPEYDWESPVFFMESIDRYGVQNIYEKDTVLWDMLFTRRLWQAFMAYLMLVIGVRDKDFLKMVTGYTKLMITFPCIDRMQYLQDYLNGSIVGVEIEKKDHFLYYFNEYASQMYKYIPGISDQYCVEPDNYYICGLFQNIFRTNEKETAINASLNYADAVLKTVLYYTLCRNNVSVKTFIKKNTNSKNVLELNFETMARYIYSMVEEDITHPLYASVVRNDIVVNQTLANVFELINDLYAMKIEADQMTFVDFIVIYRFVRNKIEHGKQVMENEEMIWNICYVLAVMLGEMLNVAHINIEMHNADILIGYENDVEMFNMNGYMMKVDDFPCLLYGIQGKKKKRQYINYWRGELWTPEIVGEDY